MIDHRTASALSGGAVDGPLQSDEAAALREHLADCAACRATDQAIRADAAELRRLDFGDAPDRLRVRIAQAAGTATASAGVGSRGLVFVVGLLMLLAAAAGAVAVGAQQLFRPSLPLLSAADSPIHWRTDVVDLGAESFAVEIDGRRFTAQSVGSVSSDPGDPTYWTLELTWQELGVEMRMNLYFASDGATWSVREIRTYDGHEDGDWLYYVAPEVRAPLGQPWIGDLDLRSVDASQPGRGPGRLVVGGLRLAVAPAREVAGFKFPDIDLGLEPVGGPLWPVGELACTGIEQLEPARAEIELRQRGYRIKWHLQRSTGPNQGTSEVVETAPDGVITGWISTGEKEVQIFVSPVGDAQAVPMAPQPDCMGGNVVAEAKPMIDVLGQGGELGCSGIGQMDPRQAEMELRARGYRLSWRLMTTTGPNTGFADIRETAPEGVITSTTLGDGGELIVFVSPVGDRAAVPIERPADCEPAGQPVPTTPTTPATP